MPWVDEVLAFWFEELTPRDWFAGGADLDARICARFGALHARLSAADGSGVAGLAGLRELQAAVIVLDQFSRQIHRDQAAAFASDGLARWLADAALAHPDAAALPAAQRLFL